MACVWEFEEPVFAEPLVSLLALNDMVADQIDAVIYELSEKL